ncbi:MAG: hypothetical protein H5U02_08935 [Clostridia bacterium]|nr:hypothetical protein [Clostridia bacterium]
MRSQPYETVFEATTRSGNFAASAVYFPEDFARLMPGKDYADYLLERWQVLENLAGEAVRVAEVPFDAESYRKWLKKSGLADGSEARGRWALHAAGDPKTLEGLRKKHPVLPAPPLDEATEALTVFVIVPAVAETPEDAEKIASRIPEACAVRIARTLEAMFPDVPRYRRLSPLRSFGLKAVAGNLLVPALLYQQAADLADAMVLAEALSEPVKADVLELPWEMRVPEDEFDFDAPPADAGDGLVNVALSLFPVTLVGASREVKYAARSADKNGAPPLAKAVARALQEIGVKFISPEIQFLVRSECTIEDLLWDFYLNFGGDAEEKPGKREDLPAAAGFLN